MPDNLDELKQKAEAGDIAAMFRLAVMYFDGDGVDVDKSEARKWWEKAAERGYARAMTYLGLMYYVGDGVKENKNKARKLWEKAAELNNAYAMFFLGMMYFYGDGVEVDKGRASEWWEKAAKLGNVQAYIGFTVLSAINIDPKKQKALLEGLLKLHDAIDDIKMLLHKKPESQGQEYACHYTTLKALRSMLEVKDANVLRMFNIGYVNDPDEGAALIKYSKSNSAVLSSFFDDERPEVDNVYFASFSLHKDRLDLWRAYGSGGDGICIVIPLSVFNDRPQEMYGDEVRAILDKNKDQIKDEPGPEGPAWPMGPEDTGAAAAGATAEPLPPLTLYEVVYGKYQEAVEKLEEILKEIQNIKNGAPANEDENQKIDKLVRMLLGDILVTIHSFWAISKRVARIVR